MPDAPISLVALSVGNTNSHIGLFDGDKLVRSLLMPSADTSAIVEAVASYTDGANTDAPRKAIVIATVNPPASAVIEQALRQRFAPSGEPEWGVYLIARDVDLPIQGRLDPEAMTGQDRVLAALAAFDVMNQAVIVVDAGTAITVDFVDGGGVFHGGAIAPGLRMSLTALQEHTAALPEVEFETPPPDVFFGRNTAQAMINGIYYSARGLVRLLSERYAEAYGAYPPVVATGGDAHALFDHDELVDRVIDDLVLRGIAVTCRESLDGANTDPGEG